MEKIGERIHIEGGEDAPLIRISPYWERGKQRLLVLWIILWSFCGLMVASRLFVDIPVKQKIIYIVFLAFWAYFEYMTVQVALCRNKGEERVQVEGDELILVQAVGKRERIFRYPLQELGSIHLIEPDERSFSDHFNDSYYVFGRMRLGVEYGNEMVRFGEKLSDEDARNLLRRMKKLDLLSPPQDP